MVEQACPHDPTANDDNPRLTLHRPCRSQPSPCLLRARTAPATNVQFGATGSKFFPAFVV
jgi:hypothetical protein